MKLRELVAIIANINEVAAILRQVATSTSTSAHVITVASDDIVYVSEKLVEYCNRLGQLVPDTEIEIEGGSDARSLE